MINFEKFTLSNGLTVVVHEDQDTQIAAVNVMYNVGARDESSHQTGLSHLFEHLMFGGSQHIPSYDNVLQQVGGNNNAYTTSDVTNYYCTLPADNLETAFWLESDRMFGLSFDPQVLAIQKKVVIEEFKEIYLNQPYGDAWLKLCDLAYKVHPYHWPVIGKDISHIEQATMDDIQAFFKTFYTPNNAILIVTGNVKLTEVIQFSKKWFESIPAGSVYTRNLLQEPIQQAPRKHTIQGNVPLNALYKAYHVPGRLSKDYYPTELLCSSLGGGKSARLYEELVHKKQYFNTIKVDTTETIDPGLLVISGVLNEGISFEQAEESLIPILGELQYEGLTVQELAKAKNQAETYLAYEAMDLLHRAQKLAMATLLGDTSLVNQEAIEIQNTTLEDVHHVAKQVLRAGNSTTIYYQRQGHEEQ